MKKLLIIITALLSVALPLAAADLDPLHPAHRYFELGFDVQAMGTNNYFNAKSLLVKDLVIDLNKIATEMPSNGLLLNAAVSGPESYWNLNLKNGFHLGMAYGIEGNVSANIGKNLFDFIGYGNVNSTTINVDGYANADLFAYYTVSGGFKLGTPLRCSVGASPRLPTVRSALRQMQSVQFILPQICPGMEMVLVRHPRMKLPEIYSRVQDSTLRVL